MMGRQYFLGAIWRKLTKVEGIIEWFPSGKLDLRSGHWPKICWRNSFKLHPRLNFMAKVSVYGTVVNSCPNFDIG
jgi:hypothetical protein